MLHHSTKHIDQADLSRIKLIERKYGQRIDTNYRRRIFDFRYQDDGNNPLLLEMPMAECLSFERDRFFVTEEHRRATLSLVWEKTILQRFKLLTLYDMGKEELGKFAPGYTTHLRAPRITGCKSCNEDTETNNIRSILDKESCEHGKRLRLTLGFNISNGGIINFQHERESYSRPDINLLDLKLKRGIPIQVWIAPYLWIFPERRVCGMSWRIVQMISSSLFQSEPVSFPSANSSTVAEDTQTNGSNISLP